MKKYDCFLENTRLIQRRFGIVPLVYGSVGLEYVTGEELFSDDIDILIPKEYLAKKWQEFKSFLEDCGYMLTDEHEHSFEKASVSYSFADIEGLEAFAGIKASEIEICEDHDVSFLHLSLEQYLKVYNSSVKDGYRVNIRKKKDNEKISFIEGQLKIKTGN